MFIKTASFKVIKCASITDRATGLKTVDVDLVAKPGEQDIVLYYDLSLCSDYFVNQNEMTFAYVGAAFTYSGTHNAAERKVTIPKNV